MDDKVLYKIPYQMLQEFGKVALENKHIDSHIETLALVTGVWSEKNLIARELIFPKQKGTTSWVEDLGNFL